MSAEELQTLTNAIEGDRVVIVLAIVLFAGTKIIETVVQMRKNGTTGQSTILTRLVADVGALKGQMEIVLSELRSMREHE